MTLNELRQKRGELVAQMRGLTDKAVAEKRDLTAEENAQWDALDSEQDGLRAQIEREEKLAGLEASQTVPTSEPYRERPDSARADGRRPHPCAGDAYAGGFDAYLRMGKNGITSDIVAALLVGTNSEGGYLTPEEFETALIAALDDENVMRRLCSVITSGSDQNIPVETDYGAAGWIAEEGAYSEGDPAFDRVVLGAHKVGKIVKVSEELLQDAFFDLGGYLVRNLGRAIGLAEEAAHVNGDGSGKPTGIVGSAGVGQTAASATAITGDELIGLYHSLRRPYRANASWLMADGTAKLIRKLKDSDGQYIWQPGLQADAPDRLLGRPAEISDNVPAVASTAKSVVFGDFSYYTIVDRAASTMVQRLNELYAANGQVGFKGNRRVDGKLTLSEAVKVLQQAV